VSGREKHAQQPMPPNDEALLLERGTRVGNYKIEGTIALGGMGVVYKATDTTLPKLQVAIKALAKVDDPDMVARFQREADVHSRIKSDYVVKILPGRGEVELRRGDGVAKVPYFVMEFLEGQSLEKLMIKVRRLPLSRVADIGIGVCLGLEACHLRGILHRDLKPGNIFLHDHGEGETPKLLDFGISVRPFSPAITSANALTGTLQYMAPEQALQRANERSDQFSLAAVLYTCLAGTYPWPKMTDVPTHIQFLLTGKYTPLREHRTDLPVEFVAILQRALAREGSDRFASTRELGQALLPFASERGQRIFADQLRAPIRVFELSEPAPIPTAAVQSIGAGTTTPIRPSGTTEVTKPEAAALETISAVLETANGELQPAPHAALAGGTRVAAGPGESAGAPPARRRRRRPMMLGGGLAIAGAAVLMLSRVLAPAPDRLGDADAAKAAMAGQLAAGGRETVPTPTSAAQPPLRPAPGSSDDMDAGVTPAATGKLGISAETNGPAAAPPPPISTAPAAVDTSRQAGKTRKRVKAERVGRGHPAVGYTNEGMPIPPE
jgi:serine/threonine protein kinase